MTKGDIIKKVDGQKAKSDNIATLLYGSGHDEDLQIEQIFSVRATGSDSLFT